MRELVRAWFERNVRFGVPANLDAITEAMETAVNARAKSHPEDFTVLAKTTIADMLEDYTANRIPGPRPVFDTAASMFPENAGTFPYNLPVGSVIAGDDADDFSDALHGVDWMRDYLKACAAESLERGYAGPLPRLSCWRVVAVGDMGDYGALTMTKLEDRDL